MMRWSGAYLSEKGVERGRLDAEHLLAHVLGLERLQLYLQHDRPLTSAELDRFRPLLRRRARREPLQYILGTAAFREVELAVDRRVLIPRPETEVLVQAVLDRVGGADGGGGPGIGASAPGPDGLTALDVGTGSGAIAVSLALEGPFARVVATDASPEALEVARANVEGAGVSDRVELRGGVLFGPLGPEERFDVVVSNPPYVADAEAQTLPPEVRDWEPAQALFAGPDGLAVLRGLLAGAPRHLAVGGLLAMEVGAGQAPLLAGLLEESEAWGEVEIGADLAGRERVLLARRVAATSGAGNEAFENRDR
jgi:release factor glutamine methyltransferase